MEEKEFRRILGKAKKGDTKAFRRLMEAYYAFVERVVGRLVLRREDAEEAVQDTFVKMWRGLASFDESQRFTTWLYRIAVNTSLDLLRREHRRIEPYEPHEKGMIDLSGADAPLLRDEAWQLYRRLAASLTPRQREVFVLRDLEGLSPDEVVRITGMTSDQVKSNLYHARKKMREKIISHERKEYL